MSSPRVSSAGEAPRRPARDIIDAVVDNMRKNLEPLKYSTLAPSRYTVYLHASEFARLEGIIPVLQEQTTRALTDELRKLNQRSPLRRWADRWRGEPDPEIRNAAADWQVEFLADPDGDLNEGDLLIDSELILPASPDLGVGERTRRITTVHAGPRTSTREQTVNRTETTPAAATLARIEYDDDAGHHVYEPDQGLHHDRAGRRRLCGRHPHRVVAGRVAGACPPPPGREDRPVPSDRSELARHDVERTPRSQGV